MKKKPKTVERKNLPLRILGIVLPEGVKLPPSRDRSHRTGIPCHPQRTPVSKGTAVARALRPPVQRRIDQRPAACQALICRDKVLDPGHHGALREAVACGSAGVVLNVQRAGERDAVLGPPAAVLGEEVGLCGAGG
jgi:hypothetical protein